MRFTRASTSGRAGCLRTVWWKRLGGCWGSMGRGWAAWLAGLQAGCAVAARGSQPGGRDSGGAAGASQLCQAAADLVSARAGGGLAGGARGGGGGLGGGGRGYSREALGFWL